MKGIKQIVRDVPRHRVGDGWRWLSCVEPLLALSREFDPFLLLDDPGPHEFAPEKAKRGVGERARSVRLSRDRVVAIWCTNRTAVHRR